MRIFPVLRLLLAALPLAAQTPVSVRILLGVTDVDPVRWDGTIQAQGGRITSIEPWRFEGTDAIVGNTWHLSTHAARLFAGTTPVSTRGANPFVPNGLIVNLSVPDNSTVLNLTTAQGDFAFRLNQLTYGKPLEQLKGRVWVDRIPASQQLTRTTEEEDYPSSATAKNGDVWLAYMQFKHNPAHNQLRAAPQTAIKDFASLKAPTGGDQVFVQKLSNGVWGQPIAVTEPRKDLYRTAIAVDGSGRAWVFWSENIAPAGGRANFEIFGRAISSSGTPGSKVRISNDPGSDIDPVATVDSSGKVWVAWQGWRDGVATILSSVQTGESFASPVPVSQSRANEWNPAIAADNAGRVTIAWDSYRNGNYDIYFRTAKSGAWGGETPLAATARYEAYPSIVYDANGRLWAAYEEGGKGWGKDFGAYSTTGVALYQGRVIRLRAFEPDGRVVETAVELGSVLPGVPNIHLELGGVQQTAQSLDPDPKNAQTRDPDRPARNMQAARNTLPRLNVDASGRIWLAFRSAHPIWWSALGTVWTEYVTSFDGAKWSNPIYLHHSDNLLDNRPAIASPRPGQLLVIGSSDNRRRFDLGEDLNSPLGLVPLRKADPYNNDLYANEIDLGPAVRPASVTAATVHPAEGGDSKVELAAIKVLHDYRKPVNGAELKIVRGEFHRHSEISMDGGSDGTILDQYRYVLDAAALDWVGCCDHDNGAGREYTWWISQKLTDIFYSAGRFSPMFSYERSVVYPEGHRNVIFAQRGVRTLPRLPVSKEAQPGRAPDTQMLYAYLKAFNGIAASHTSATAMGTDWRDNDPLVEPAVEIYQGDRQNYEKPGAPKSNSEKDSIGQWRPKGFVSAALEKGYKLAFEASSDHVSTHMSYANLLVKDNTREAVLEAFQKRHLYAATDNILADVSCGQHIMGDAFSTVETPKLHVKLAGTSNFAKVVIVKDNEYVYSVQPNSPTVDFTWRDNAPVTGKASYYYVRGEQDDGELVWASPLWITYTGK